ncbi:hypothetical protein [Sorangium sp. So ce1182]|uniref:hypothetical protein n=1 Tax=Sorangium sp. So ce1182 TaxID=3133334 RepID=UPI003F5FC946
MRSSLNAAARRTSPGANPGGGFVFSVGSVNFGQSLVLDAQLKQLVKNALTIH